MQSSLIFDGLFAEAVDAADTADSAMWALAVPAYVIAGVNTWDRWLGELPFSDPMRAVERGEGGFTPQMLWAFWTVRIMFVLTWPCWVLLRGLFQMIDLFADPAPTPGRIRDQRR